MINNKEMEILDSLHNLSFEHELLSISRDTDGNFIVILKFEIS